MIVEPHFATSKYGFGLSFSQNNSQQATYPFFGGICICPSQSQISGASGGDIKKCSCTLMASAEILLSVTSKQVASLLSELPVVASESVK